MTREELANLLTEHGENYDADGYHGCDCGLPCSAAEHADHLAAIASAASPTAAVVLDVLDRLGSLHVINESEAAVQAEYDSQIRAALLGSAATGDHNRLTNDERRELFAVGRNNRAAFIVPRAIPVIEHILADRLAEALERAASDAEWKFRSMTFHCGRAESETKPHPVGAWLRERAATIRKAADA